MKAERRHELQQNTLDQALTRAPDLARKYGGMILLVTLAVIVGYMLIRYRISSAREGHRIATENLATARTNIDQLGQLHTLPIAPQQLLDHRKRLADDARLAIDSVTNGVSDPKLLAEALLAKGDLNWALAQMDEPPAAATQPALRLDTDKKTLLGEAESAYQEVANGHPEQRETVIAARFGLAAVHEANGAWDKAKAEYDMIAKDESASAAYREQAKFRLERADQWSRPVTLAAATQPAAPTGIPFLQPPTSSPATTAPAVSAAPTTQATATAAPATRPVER
jgi:hypothetical protein